MTNAAKIFTLLPFLLLSPSTSFAAEKAQTFTLTEGETSVKIPFYQVNGLLMNDLCKKDLDHCDAYLASKKAKTTMPDASTDGKTVGNPATSFCKKLSGMPVDVVDEKKNEVAMCTFDDETMISSWDLFHAKNGKGK